MATSKLQRKFGDMLDKNFPRLDIKENHKPNWLISSGNTQLELDFYIEELGLAYEVQGAQHFEYVPFFHKSMDDFKLRRKYDEEKYNLCCGRRVKLIEIMTETDAIVAIENIKSKIKTSTPKYFYQEEQNIQENRRLELENARSAKAERIPKRKIILSLKMSNRKFKRQNIDDERLRAERAERCKNKLEMVERGELQAPPEKIAAWKKVIEQNGFTL